MTLESSFPVTFLPEAARRELHARNADEPATAPAPWLLLTVPAAGAQAMRAQPMHQSAMP
jgi:hypothetical protein